MITIIYKADVKSNFNLRNQLIAMFEDMNDTLILSCLQGHMGEIWVDDIKSPTVAQALVGIFVFYAGDTNSKVADELLCNIPENILAIVNTHDWKHHIETLHRNCIEKFQRYAFKKDVTKLNYNHIQSFLSILPEGYELKKVDEIIINKLSFQELSEDLIGQFESIDDFMNRGYGFCILYNGEVVCGATSFSIYDGGIEIEVDTNVNHRRKGLATVASSALILDCLEIGIYPNWDAANLDSVNLAQKFGYVLHKPYDTYYINYIY